MKVYQMYKDMLFNSSFRIVKNEQDAQDMTHDAFIKAFKNISKLEKDLNLGPWLKRIVINCSLDFIRKKQKINCIEEQNQFKDDDKSEELIDENVLKIDDIKKAINELKDKYRIIITLYLVEDYTHKEIAEQLNLKESTVRNQYIRGKQQLKQKLQSRLVL